MHNEELADHIIVLMFFSMINNRRKQMVVVDKRVRLLSEVIGSIRAVKLYAYEAFFGDKVMELRREELEMLRRNGANRAVMFSTITFVPTLATVCKCRFVDHNVFSSLTQ
jgi:ATP-binding cassette subfamily C (CFTR/MRP) protein 1